MEASTERLRENLRRPHASGREQLMKTATYAVNAIVAERTLEGKGVTPCDELQEWRSEDHCDPAGPGVVDQTAGKGPRPHPR